MNIIVRSSASVQTSRPLVVVELLDLDAKDLRPTRHGETEGVAFAMGVGEARQIGYDIVEAATAAVWDRALRRTLKDKIEVNDEAVEVLMDLLNKYVTDLYDGGSHRV